MEKETDFFHLFTQHQVVIFVVGSSLFIVTFLLATGVFLSRRAESKRRQHGDASEPRTSFEANDSDSYEIDLADTLERMVL